MVCIGEVASQFTRDSQTWQMAVRHPSTFDIAPESCLRKAMFHDRDRSEGVRQPCGRLRASDVRGEVSRAEGTARRTRRRSSAWPKAGPVSTSTDKSWRRGREETEQRQDAHGPTYTSPHTCQAGPPTRRPPPPGSTPSARRSCRSAPSSRMAGMSIWPGQGRQ